MAVIPTTRSSFTSTVWNSPGKAAHSTNAAKFGGPNVNIKEGSKIQLGDGDLIWDVARVFEDGTLFLTTTSSGMRLTRRIPPDNPSWSNIWMVDEKVFRNKGDQAARETRRLGGGPNRNLQPGNVVVIGTSQVRWTVQSLLRDGTVVLITVQNEELTSTKIGPTSRLWNSMYPVSR